MAVTPEKRAWIGAQLRERRERLRLTLSQVAELADISVDTLTKLENAKGPSRETTRRIKLGIVEALRWPEDAFDYLERGELPPEDAAVTDSDDSVIVAKLDEILSFLRSQGVQPSPPPRSDRPAR